MKHLTGRVTAVLAALTLTALLAGPAQASTHVLPPPGGTINTSAYSQVQYTVDPVGPAYTDNYTSGRYDTNSGWSYVHDVTSVADYYAFASPYGLSYRVQITYYSPSQRKTILLYSYSNPNYYSTDRLGYTVVDHAWYTEFQPVTVTTTLGSLSFYGGTYATRYIYSTAYLRMP